MLLETLGFFATATVLVTIVALIGRGPAARVWIALPAGAVIIAAAAGIIVLLSGDVTGAEILAAAAAVIWLVSWVLFRRWGALAALMMSMLLAASLVYLAYAAWQTVLQVSGPVVLVASIVLLLMETAALLLTVSYAFEMLDVLGRRKRAESPLPTVTDTELPHVALQVPTYNEPIEVVSQTLDALARVEYPHLIVQVVDNNTKDPAIWQPLQQLCETLGPRFQFMHLEDWPGYKAGALNEATKRLPEDVNVVGIIDADYVVDPGFLRAMAPHFADPRVDFVQCAQHYRDWEDDRYLRGLFYSYRYFFDVTLPARARRNAIIFCGTMGLIRRSALERIGGWNEDCITEDSEASLRMLGSAECTGVYDPRPWGHGLMPLTFDGLKKQRFRWALGGIQMLRLHWRDLLPFAPHRMRLTLSQRLLYLAGSMQWFGELLTLAFTVLLVLTAVTAGLHHRLPIRQLTGAVLVIPVLFLGTGLLRALWALRRTTGCTWGDAWRALRVWFSLSWVVSLACIRGLVRFSASFLRTPKSSDDEGTLRRALRFSLWETLLAAVAVLSAGFMLAASLSVATVLLAAMLLFEAFVYLSAPWASMAAEGVRLTPLRSAYLHSSQNTGERPERRFAAPALASAVVLAAAAAVVAALVVNSPPDQAPFTPNRLPPLGTVTRANAATPSPSASPTPTAAPVTAAPTAAPTPVPATPTPAAPPPKATPTP